MRALIAFDKFKDALTARAACAAAATAMNGRHPDWQLDLCPLTDGGEGFCETLCQNSRERIEPITVHGPRGASTIAPVGFVSSSSLTTKARQRINLAGHGTIAVAGLASASGIELLARDQRDPWHTSTFGTGEFLKYAAHEKVDAILLGVGGSATNDLGLGALAALGFQFLDTAGETIPVPTPATWERITRIDASGAIALPRLFIACDVTNPLLGPTGATTTFGPQKGLRHTDLPRLEAQAARIAALLCEACHKPLSLAATPGAGAAGGIAFGLMVATNAKLVAGFDLVSDWLALPARIAAADLIITGEGRFDATSLGGKGPGSLVREAQRLGKPAYIFSGSFNLPDKAQATMDGIKVHAITPKGMPLAEALPRTAELLAAAINRAL
jgi:glycerate kinase